MYKLKNPLRDFSMFITHQNLSPIVFTKNKNIKP